MSEIYRLSKTPSETGQVRGEVNASVLDVVDTRFDIDEKEETLDITPSMLKKVGQSEEGFGLGDTGVALSSPSPP